VKPVLIRPAAAADVEEAYWWYESQRPGLGAEFRAAFRDAVNSITENPDRYPVVYRRTRRVLLKRFPYGVYYREYTEAIIVVACIHGRRDPRRWQSRSD
jgi:toxin ParE1/3/4